MKLLTCKNAGFDCDYIAFGETPAAVLRKIGEHAISYHGMMEITAADNDEWRLKIQDASDIECALRQSA